MLSAAVLISSSASSYVAPVVGPRMQNAVARANAPAMDETILEKALAGELEEEGAENVFMSELGWATYLDQNAGSSYNMNERPSLAQDGYFTADIFSNPVDGAAVPGLEERGTAPCCSVRDLTRPLLLDSCG